MLGNTSANFLTICVNVGRTPMGTCFTHVYCSIKYSDFWNPSCQIWVGGLWTVHVYIQQKKTRLIRTYGIVHKWGGSNHYTTSAELPLTSCSDLTIPIYERCHKAPFINPAPKWKCRIIGSQRNAALPIGWGYERRHMEGRRVFQKLAKKRT